MDFSTFSDFGVKALLISNKIKKLIIKMVNDLWEIRFFELESIRYFQDNIIFCKPKIDLCENRSNKVYKYKKYLHDGTWSQITSRSRSARITILWIVIKSNLWEFRERAYTLECDLIIQFGSVVL